MSDQLYAMLKEWGVEDAYSIVKTTHKTSNATTNPTNVKLPQPFVVCIVGASRGIGAGIALSYAKAGASALILASRRTSGLEETAKQCKAINPNINISIAPCDISSPDSVSALATHCKTTFDHLDVVVVNSGYAGPSVVKLTETEDEDFITATNVNYIGTFLCAKYLIPLLLATTDGAKAFIGVNSLSSLIVRGPIAHAKYCCSKTAQLKLLEHVHEQYHEEGLAAYAVHPGAVRSEMSEPAEHVEYLTDDPELCGSFCVWLTKEGSKRSWLSGRLLSATWDADELEGLKDEIVKNDLLKLKLTV